MNLIWLAVDTLGVITTRSNEFDELPVFDYHARGSPCNLEGIQAARQVESCAII